MPVRLATVTDAASLVTHYENQETGYYPIDACREALAMPHMTWATDGLGAFCGVGFFAELDRWEVGPLLPLTMHDPTLALQLLRLALVTAFIGASPRQRLRPILTVFSADQVAQITFFRSQFAASEETLPGGLEHDGQIVPFVKLSLPTLQEARYKAVAWPL